MKTTDDGERFEMAREAVDQELLHELLEEVSGRDVDQEAARALQEVAAEEILLAAIGASTRARRRVRAPEAEDVAAAVEDRRGCCGVDGTMEPLFAVREGE